jgi:DegV family protein with EDD domain
MKRVRVVTDTTANMPAALVSELGIGIVPYCIQFGGQTFYEPELSREEFHRRIGEGVFPKTSQPPVGKFVEVFQEAAKDASAIICITLTSAHSGGYASAMAAKELTPGVPIEVIDSRAISLGTGFMALAAARAAMLGKGVSEIVPMLLSIRERVHHYIALDTLKYLQMGGRVSAFQTILATMLSVKPILHVKDGALLPFERVRTRSISLQRVMEVTEKALGKDLPVRLAVMHDQAAEDCRYVLETLKARLNVIESFTGDLSLALTSHSGPGMVGVIGYTVGPGEP